MRRIMPRGLPGSRGMPIEESEIESQQGDAHSPVYSPRVQPDMLQQAIEKRRARGATQYIKKKQFEIIRPLPTRLTPYSQTTLTVLTAVKLLNFNEHRVSLVIGIALGNGRIYFGGQPPNVSSTTGYYVDNLTPFIMNGTTISTDEIWGWAVGGNVYFNVLEGVPLETSTDE